jgi:hypothetical protein
VGLGGVSDCRSRWLLRVRVNEKGEMISEASETEGYVSSINDEPDSFRMLDIDFGNRGHDPSNGLASIVPRQNTKISGELKSGS